MNGELKCNARVPNRAVCQGILRPHAPTSEHVASCGECKRNVPYSELVCCGCYTRGGMHRVEIGLGVFSARCKSCGGKYSATQLLSWMANDLQMMVVNGVKVQEYRPPAMPGVTSSNY